MGLWEILHNPNFKRVEFDTFKKDAGTNAYTFSIKEWNQNLNGIRIVTKSGRYGGGIFAHTDAIKENLEKKVSDSALSFDEKLEKQSEEVFSNIEEKITSSKRIILQNAEINQNIYPSFSKKSSKNVGYIKYCRTFGPFQ